jgi:hypothetical protein
MPLGIDLAIRPQGLPASLTIRDTASDVAPAARKNGGRTGSSRDPKRDASRLGTQSAYGPSSKGVRPMNRLRRTSQVHAPWLGCGTGGGHVRSVHAPEPPFGFMIYDLRFIIWVARLRRDALIRVHPIHLRLRYPWLSVLHLPSVASVCSVVQWGFFCDLVLLGDLCVPSASLRAGLGARIGSGCDHVCATVQKEDTASEKFFIPSGTRSCAIFGRCLRTEFRQDSCNTAPI